MSISPSCRDIVLAGRQGLLIIDLENPWSLPRILPHMSKWEVADVQWSPYVVREAWVASTSNQKLLIWNLNYGGSQAIENVFHAHSRAISDINWSPHHPDMLATCSVDTYVHIWDLRSGNNDFRPAHSFTSWNAATTQVKYNRKSEYLLASAHDKDVKIWDIRKGAVPITTISAHTKKIYGIDWSRQNDHDIYWNIHAPEKEQEAIMTNFPVWRARNTPFGNGVLTMPQRTETTLYLYSRDSPAKAVHTFEGHTDTVKEFVWRWKGGNGPEDDREFQLVTWSKDQYLRLWPISADVLKVGKIESTVNGQPVISASLNTLRKEAEEYSPSAMSLFRSGTNNGSAGMASGYDSMSHAYREQKYAINPLLWMQNVKTVGPPTELRRAATTESTYQTVAEEMSTVLNKYSSMGINGAARTCTITLHGPWSDTGSAFLRITIRFSSQYPDNSPPEFDIQKNSMVSIYYRAHMSQDLSSLASSYTSQKRWCLEACIRYLLGETGQEDGDLGLGPNGASDVSLSLNNGQLANGNQPGGYLSAWNGSGSSADNGDSDDEIFAGPPFMGGVTGGYAMAGKRVSLQSERGIVVDMSSKQSADEKVPFPRLCGGVFSGDGHLVCFFSTLRVRDSKRNQENTTKGKRDSPDGESNSNNAYFENTYSDFYKHPRTYEQFEEYKEIAAMSRQGRNATVLVGGSGGAFGEYAYDDDPDDIDDSLTNMTSLYLKPNSLGLGGSIANTNSMMYRNLKTDRITHNVVLADLRDIMPYSAQLAKEYILSPEDPVAACTHNAAVCLSHKRHDLSKVWYLASEILRQCVPVESERSWASLPLESPFWKNDIDLSELRALLYDEMPRKIKTVKRRRATHETTGSVTKFAQCLRLQHFIGSGDVQTAAMMSCIFHSCRNSSLKTPQAQVTKTYFSDKMDTVHSRNEQRSSRAQALMRTGSGPVSSRANSPDRTTTSQMSASYGGRGSGGGGAGSGFLSYFWDSERHTPPGEKQADLSTIEPSNSATSKRTVSHPFNMPITPQRLPSNTAPGLRSLPGSPRAQTRAGATLIAPVNNTETYAWVSDKEGNLVQSSELTIEFMNLETFDGEKALSHSNDIPLLDPSRVAQLDVLRLSYGDMLHRWGLLEQRAEILKFLSRPPFSERPEEMVQVQIRCYSCGSEVASRDRICYTCRKVRSQIRCSICHVLVKGLVNFCSKCGHGGHSTHIKDWFSKQKVCPTGCGCSCLAEG
ncbi:hypothetical protein BX666DRAFT_1848601 [Dichotomocladium elegans]|nr:hypothetical protein BX666DRAFT_1848601 [Dichotomocladium elegans]